MKTIRKGDEMDAFIAEIFERNRQNKERQTARYLSQLDFKFQYNALATIHDFLGTKESERERARQELCDRYGVDAVEAKALFF
ncbi:hypothetical protein [Piscirickettsia litoralis]|uniref:Uncharacterized protein n=1 Tax=Piscirickettsia litoralis TaxID=1891921 RepID=A0ABX2ZXQ5_9GAMM|nr:hypothetical protein [Piscirickettsia litoralis]ODN41381.1 hypothetical protein BGC07_16565 [Piscirickettsia litoralis]